MQIQLTSDIETALTEYARSQGLPPETLALKVLREYLLPPPATIGEMKEKKETLADCLGEHIGVISSDEHVPGGAQLSEDCGKKFTKTLLKKRGHGKL